MKTLNDKLESIAKKYLGIVTLRTRHNDSLDFYDVSVWGILAALKSAYELGRRDAISRK